MLHHYNYSTTLSHFLNYRQVEVDRATATETDHASSTENIISDQFNTTKCIKNQSSEISSKSFTIAAILGLGNNNNNNNDSGELQNSATDLSVVDLSVHPSGTTDRSLVSNCNRLQLPVRHSSSAVGVTTHYSVGHGCPPRQTVSGLRHLPSSNLSNNKKSCKSKRVRTIFTPEQLERLEVEFSRQQYMVGPERVYLAQTLQLTEAQVKVWFQNRRIKWRKHHLELTHQRLALMKQQQLLIDDTHPDIQDTNSSSTDT